MATVNRVKYGWVRRYPACGHAVACGRLPKGMRKTLLILVWATSAGAETASFDHVQSVLKQYCVGCHQGARAAGKIDLTQYRTPESVAGARGTWTRVLARVRGSDMPPKGSPAPGID